LQGSFAVDTAIKNPNGDYDIDRSIVISSDNAPSDPLAPKNAILDVLISRNFQNPKIKMPCVTADYLSSNLHIDFTVYAKDQYGDFKLAVGKKGSSDDIKEWSQSNPTGLKEWISSTANYGENALEKRKQFKRLVRYMKRWRDETFGDEVKKKIFSIGLTIMIKNEYQPDSWTSTLENDLSALKKVVDNILTGLYLRLASTNPEQYRLYVTLPCHGSRNIFNHKAQYAYSEQGSDKNIGTQLRNKLALLQSSLNDAIALDDEVEQCKVLNRVFGSDFVVPTNSNSKSAGLASAFPSVGVAGTSQGAVE
jgi:hypothetical protein